MFKTGLQEAQKASSAYCWIETNTQTAIHLGWSPRQLAPVKEALEQRHPQRPSELMWEVICQIVLSVVANKRNQTGDHQTTYYSRSHEYYDNIPKRYKSHKGYTYYLMVGALDWLVAQGYLNQCIGVYNPKGKGFRSHSLPKPKLLDIIPETDRARPEGDQYLETIVFKDKEGNETDYEDSTTTNIMRMEMERINSYLNTIQYRTDTVPWQTPGAMRRIFNKSWDRGGRLYARGNSWQNCPKEDRSKILIKDQEGLVSPTSEIDYECLHIHLLYKMQHVKLDFDPYYLEGFDRKFVKVATMKAQNARNKHEAARSIAEAWRDPQQAHPSKSQIAEGREVLDRIEALHPKISNFVASDVGAQLQRTDSDLMVKVVSQLLTTGTPALPVHDSILVRQSDIHKALSTMERLSGAIPTNTHTGITPASPATPTTQPPSTRSRFRSIGVQSFDQQGLDHLEEPEGPLRLGGQWVGPAP